MPFWSWDFFLKIYKKILKKAGTGKNIGTGKNKPNLANLWIFDYVRLKIKIIGLKLIFFYFLTDLTKSFRMPQIPSKSDVFSAISALLKYSIFWCIFDIFQKKQKKLSNMLYFNRVDIEEKMSDFDGICGIRKVFDYIF